MTYDVLVTLESAKTHLQHIASAAAINLSRLSNWFKQIPRAQTRTSSFAALETSI